MSSDNQNKQQRIVVSGVLEQDGQYLIVQRAEHETFLPGKYEFPGGKVEFGESAEDALVREFLEETGIEVVVGDVIRSFTFLSNEDSRHSVEFVYFVRPKNEGVTDVVLGNDHQNHAWTSMSDLQQYDMTDEIVKTFKALGYQEKSEQKTLMLDDKKATDDTMHIYTDGGSRGNPGPSATGYVLMTPDEQIIEEGGEYLGITTNNQAEYQAVKLALEAAEKYHPKKIRFFIDSLLVVNQMNGTYKIKNRDLWPIHENIKELMRNFEDVTFTHVRREFNKLADGKVNEVLDSYNHR